MQKSYFLNRLWCLSNGMDKFEQKGMKKIRPIENRWYDWLIN